MLKMRPKRRSLNKIEDKEPVSSKRKKTEDEESENDEEEEEEEDEDEFSPMDNTDEDSDYNPTKEKTKSSSSEEEDNVESESKFFKTNSFGVPKKPPWYKSNPSPGTSSNFKIPAPKQRTLLDSDSSSDEFERVPDSLDDLGGFERLKKEVTSEDSENEMETDSKVTEYFDFSQIIQNQEVLKAAAVQKEKDGGKLAPGKRVKLPSSGKKKIKNSSNNDENNDVMKLLAMGEGAKLEAKKKKKKGGESDSDEEDSDDEYEETKPKHSKGVEVTIAFSSQNQHKKKEKKTSDVEAALKRRFNLIKKENQVFAHKVHLLCWIAHGNHLNTVLNCEDLMGVALSIIPSNYCYPPKRCDLTYLENFVKWFRERIKIDPVLGKDSLRPDRIVTSQSLQAQFNKQMANSRLDQLLLFIATLRALGLLVRLIVNLRPVPLKPPVKELFTIKSPQESVISSKSGKSKMDDNVEKVKKEGEEGKGEEGGTIEKKTKNDGKIKDEEEGTIMKKTANKIDKNEGNNEKNVSSAKKTTRKKEVKEENEDEGKEEGKTNVRKSARGNVKDKGSGEANKKEETSEKKTTEKNTKKGGNENEGSKKEVVTSAKKMKKKDDENDKLKENEESSSPEITKQRTSRRNVKNIDEIKEEKSCSSGVKKRSSKRNDAKKVNKEESGNCVDKEEEEEGREKAKQDKTRSKALSKSKVVEDEDDEIVIVEEFVTRNARRPEKIVNKREDNGSSSSKSIRSSRSSTKLAEKNADTPKINKVPDDDSIINNKTEKKSRSISVSSAKKINDKSEEKGTRSKSMSSKNEDKEVEKKSGNKKPLVGSASTSKYFEDKTKTPKNNMNGYKDAEEGTGRGKRQKKKLVENLKEAESSDEEEEEEKNKKKTGKGRSSVAKKSVGSVNKSIKKKATESDEEFELESSYFKSKNKIDRRVLSSDDDVKSEANKKNKKKNQTDEWAEVFLEAEEKWICVDLTKGMIHCVQQLYSSANQPVTHVLGWENNKCIKDVTRRYVPHFMTVTRKQRVEDEWWRRALRPFAPPRNARNREEDDDLDKQMEDQPLPTSISEYKNHPLYALQRHLLKFQAIYPPDAPTLGFIRNEPVYSRTCVAELHCRESWIKFAKVVRAGEEPYKMVKARPKFDKMTGEFRSDLPLPLFGPWQVDDYVPPPAKDGKVPRNEYGNVELFQPSMLPAGTVHLKLPGLNRVAKKLQIDCAAAVVGWDFHGGSSHVVMDGFIVCEEFEETLVEAWHQEQQEAEKRAREKMEQKVYGNWKRLIKGLLIREKLKLKYGFEIEDEVTAGSSGKGQKSKKGESSKGSKK